MAFYFLCLKVVEELMMLQFCVVEHGHEQYVVIDETTYCKWIA